jgi:hypothetical protein
MHKDGFIVLVTLHQPTHKPKLDAEVEVHDLLIKHHFLRDAFEQRNVSRRFNLLRLFLEHHSVDCIVTK